MPHTGIIQEIYLSPKTVEWTINIFFLLNREIGYFADSPNFTFQEYSCRLTILPKGKDSLPNITALTLTGIGRAGTVRWELEVRRTDDTVLRKCSGWKEHGCEEEMTMLIPFNEVERECSDRSFLRVICTLYNEDDIRREREVKRYKQTGSQTEAIKRTDKLSFDLEELLSTGNDSNVTIRVEDQEFKVHKSILGARSPVLTSMFQHTMSENITGMVNIDDCDPITFREFLRYLYSGRVEKLSPNTVLSLYKISDKYQVDDLKAYCLEYIKNNLSVDIFCDVIIMSVQYDEEELMDAAKKFLSKNMKEILDSENWQIFLSENPSLSNQLLLKALRLQKLQNK